MALPAKKLPLLSVHAALSRADPTRTMFLSRAFARDLAVRFLKLRQVITRAIVTEDCFAYQPQIRPILIQAEMVTPGLEAFNFPRSDQKVQAFMDWLKQQEKSGLLEVSDIPQLGGAVEAPWTNKYISDAYQRGVQRARYELARAGYGMSSAEAAGGVVGSLSLPFHIDRVGLLYSRTFTGLKGITDAMDLQLSTVLSQAMADGENPRRIAKLLNATIKDGGGDLGITDTLGRFIPAERRAAMLARTEIIRAFHAANINEMKQWGVAGVTVKAEWVTAGFAVCPQCVALEGRVFSLDEIANMIPRHPNCRCVALPSEVAK